MKIEIEAARDAVIIASKRNALAGLARTGETEIEFTLVPLRKVRDRDARMFGGKPERARDRSAEIDEQTLEWLIDDRFVLPTQTLKVGRRAETVLALLRAKPSAKASAYFAPDHVEIHAVLSANGKPIRSLPREARLAQPKSISVNVDIVKRGTEFHYQSSSWKVRGKASSLAGAKRAAAKEMWQKIAVTWDDDLVLSIGAARVEFFMTKP